MRPSKGHYQLSEKTHNPTMKASMLGLGSVCSGRKKKWGGYVTKSDW